jgi:hypothetical protein
MAAEIRTAKSPRHGSVVITIHFPRFVFLTCGNSQNARACTLGGMLAYTVMMEQVSEMHTYWKTSPSENYRRLINVAVQS